MPETNNVLPGPLRDLLQRLRGRLRGAWTLQGLGYLLLGLTLLFATLFTIDALLGLSTSSLQIAFGVWLAAGLVLLGQKLFVPLLRPVPDPTLAALVERQHPELSERLLTLADLSQAEGHASPTMVAALAEETLPLAAHVQPGEVIPLTHSWRLLGLGLGAVLLAFLPLAFSSNYERFGQRFFRACFDPYHGYEVRVTPGTVAMAQDQSLTVTAELMALDDGPLPRSCHLVLLDAAGEQRLRMPLQEPVAFRPSFAVRLDRVSANRTYCVEAGEVRSAPFQITAVPPILLAEGYPKIRIVPPAYVAAAIHKTIELQQVSDFAALQYSQASFTCRFDRPPQAVRWQGQRLSAEPKASSLENSQGWQWSADRRELTMPVPTDAAGAFSAVLEVEAEHGISNTIALPRWQVWEDRPPTFLHVQQGFTVGQVAGLPKEKGAPSPARANNQVDPDDVLTFRFTLIDDVGLEDVRLEYRVYEGPGHSFPLATGNGQLTLQGEKTFPLRAKVKDGSELKWRLVGRDNRNLPEKKLGPQTVYHPARVGDQDQWQSLKVQRGGDPAQHRDILGQRDEVQQKIAAIRKKVEAERAQVGQMRSALHQHTFLPPDKLAALKKLRLQNQAITDDLVDLAREVSPTPLLEHLGDKALDLAEGEMKRAGQNLGKAEDKGANPPQREGAMQSAENELLAALKRLDELSALNQRLAQDRLDLMNLEKLARREQDLADRIAQLEKDGKLDDPAAKAELEQLRQEQQQLAAQMKKLTEQSELMQKMMPSRESRQARDLAQRARELAMQQRKLAEAKKGKDDPDSDPLLILAKKQEELGKALQPWQKELKPPPVAGVSEPALAAAGSMRRGDIPLALKDQEKTLQGLEGLMRSLGGNQPRDVVLRAHKLQEGILRELEKLGEDFPRLTAEQARARLAALLPPQASLTESLEKLKPPDNVPAAKQLLPQVQQLTREVMDRFQKRSALDAFEKIEETLPVLQRLAQALPETKLQGNDGVVEAKHRQGAKEAADFHKKQFDLHQALKNLAAKMEAGGGASGEAEQKRLQEESDKLANEMMKLAQSKEAAKGKAGAEGGAHSAMEAAQAMDKANKDKKDPDQAQKEAALKLEMAAKQLDDAAKMMQPKDGSEAGKDLDEGAEKMAEASKKLEQGQPKAAKQAMQQAAQAMTQAAQATTKMMSKSQRPPNQPNLQSRLSALPAAPGGSGQLPPGALDRFAGKTWGDLPGELQTQLLHDLGTRYGEEYAPIIQRYFQQLADVPVIPGTKR